MSLEAMTDSMADKNVGLLVTRSAGYKAVVPERHLIARRGAVSRLPVDGRRSARIGRAP
jgi:hypothetical protein